MNKLELVKEIKKHFNSNTVFITVLRMTKSSLKADNFRNLLHENELEKASKRLKKEQLLEVLNKLMWDEVLNEETPVVEEAQATEVFENKEVASTVEENETPTFTQILTHVQENTGLKVIGIGKSYFTVENQEGYRAYFQVDTYGYHYENPNYYKGFSFSTCHKPNRNTGTGWQHIYLQYNAKLDEIVTSLYETLGRSRHNIITGKEKMDTREK
ncbi:hypothetical protein PP657_gp009 [Bacillus phage BCPST]|uniref:Uncharacterized protein n=1 Tax=Bacillus phage BCPST TaxID=2801506 RepID=A0AAE7P3H0_9CAUD|nr:hypothetical protein PP657_gp009 [Bacillus phage BCPST]QQO38627.1 hypothetical protein BCPST_009 [Bacillus phage BCPST]QSJ04216.1 hypothetical protein BCP6_011 [Bacillus phage BCP6]